MDIKPKDKINVLHITTFVQILSIKYSLIIDQMYSHYPHFIQRKNRYLYISVCTAKTLYKYFYYLYKPKNVTLEYIEEQLNKL